MLSCSLWKINNCLKSQNHNIKTGNFWGNSRNIWLSSGHSITSLCSVPVPLWRISLQKEPENTVSAVCRFLKLDVFLFLSTKPVAKAHKIVYIFRWWRSSVLLDFSECRLELGHVGRVIIWAFHQPGEMAKSRQSHRAWDILVSSQSSVKYLQQKINCTLVKNKLNCIHLYTKNILYIHAAFTHLHYFSLTCNIM